MTRLPAYILAGGKSSRFGSDKARATVDGSALIERIAAATAPVATGTTVVAAVADAYADLGLRTIGDVVPDLGPMGGLRTALLDNRENDWLLLLSCDLLHLEPTWVGQLLAHRQPDRPAVAFRPDRWQPLLAIYHARILPQVEARLARSDLAMQPLLTDSRCVEAPLPPDWPAILQANRPDQLPGPARS